MVDILTDGGAYLNIAPDFEFEIEMDNPMFEDGGIPVAFSTSIPFLPTPTNRGAFGWAGGAHMLPPAVTRLGATLLVDGVPFMSGTLTFDSVDEGGTASYTFASRDPDEEWDCKLYELAGLPTVTGDGIGTLVDYARGLMQTEDPHEENPYPDIKAPLLVDGGMLATNCAEDRSEKYQNSMFGNDDKDSTPFTPAVRLSRLLSESGVAADASLSDILSSLYMVAPHKGEEWSGKMYPSDALSIADCLPDVSVYDFVMACAKLLCASVHCYKGAFVLVPNSLAFGDADSSVPDWTGKVSDMWSGQMEEATGYKLSYANSDDSYNEKTSKSSRNGILRASSVSSFWSFATSATAAARYTSIKLTTTGTVWSVKYDNSQVLLADLLYRNEPVVDKSGSGGTRDMSTAFKLVDVVPCGTDSRRSWAAKADAVSPGGDRETDMLIGTFADGTLMDRGGAYSGSGSPEDLAPASLYEARHKAFAEWLAKDRQAVTADADLTLSDITGLKMWLPVMVQNRLFIVRKLTMSLKAREARILSTVDLVER